MKPGITSERSFAEVEGIRTAYYRGGRGPMIVLLHGGAPGACSDLNWFRTFDPLIKSGYEVVAYDQPGFGHSQSPKDHSIEFRYRHAYAFLRFLEVTTPVLIGNSIGGLLAVLLALRSQGVAGPKIDRLILAAPFPHFALSEKLQAERAQHRGRLSGIEQSQQSIRTLCLNTFYDPAYASDELVQFRLGMLEGENWAAHKERAKIGSTFDMESIKGRSLDVPALVIWGREDRSVQVDVGIEAMSHLDKARFLFLPNCAHWPQIEQAEPFNAAVIDFLRTMPGGNSTSSSMRSK
jgi:pimeloyl-ACP methyl ester carboxylesterase